MSELPTLAHATDFIVSHATDDDLNRVVAAVKQRRAALAAITAAAVTTGTAVRLRGLKPRYLNDLTGTVAQITGQHAAVRLDAASTDRLRYDGARRFQIPADETAYELTGVPLICCHPAS